jgi:hypothetical protein
VWVEGWERRGFSKISRKSLTTEVTEDHRGILGFVLGCRQWEQTAGRYGQSDLRFHTARQSPYRDYHHRCHEGSFAPRSRTVGSAYAACLAHELRKQAVEDTVIVELKCTEGFHPIHQAQLLSYLKLSGKNVGLLINFHVTHLRNGIQRMVNGKNWGK